MKMSFKQPIEHVKAFCEIGPRPPTTAAEARAADYVKTRLEAAGARDVSVEPFRSIVKGWMAFSIASALGIASSAIYYLGGRWAWIWSVLLCALVLLILLAEAGFWRLSLSNLLPKGSSQNVYGKIPPKGKPARKLVVIGHLDTARTPILFHAVLVRYFNHILISVGVFVLIKLLVFLIGSIFWNSSGVMITALILDIPIAVVLLVVLHGDFLSPFTEGANDNATGAAVALSLAEFLAREPLAQTEYWALCTGCEEVMLTGIRAFLERHADELKDASFVNLECLGIGTLRCITYEGMLKKFHSDPVLVRALSEAAKGEIEQTPLKRGDTETFMILRRGLKAVTIMAFPKGTEQVPHWHRVSDRFGNISAKNLEKALTYLVALARKLDS